MNQSEILVIPRRCSMLRPTSEAKLMRSVNSSTLESS